MPKNKLKLVAILKEDKRPDNRAAAAFLLARIKNRTELINFLTPSILDSEQLVRNNVMRVLGITLMDGKIPVNFPTKDVFHALDFPEAANRNKALLILLVLSKDPKYKREIIQNSGDKLLDLLKLLQPNNHDIAYEILKQISGKQYGERDYISWKKWLNLAKNRAMSEFRTRNNNV